MIGGGEIARRYAQAVFGLGQDAAARRQLLDDLATLAQEISDSSELQHVLLTPIHPRTERKALIQALSERLGISQQVLVVSELLVDHNRIWLDRSVGIAAISGEEAVDWGWTGPCLRASAT